MKNPVLQIQIEDSDGRVFNTVVPVTSQLKSGKIAGVAFSVAQNENKNGAYIAFSADKCFSIPYGKSGNLTINGSTFTFKCKSDLVKSEEVGFGSFLKNSVIVHAALLLALGLWITFGPKEKVIVNKTAVKVDMDRVNDLLKKMEKKKEKKVVKKKVVKKKKIVKKKKPKLQKLVKSKKKIMVAKRPKKPKKNVIKKVRPKVQRIAKNKTKRISPPKASLNNITKKAQASAPKKVKVKVSAQAKAQLAQSMNFLSTSKAKFNFKGKPSSRVSGSKKYAGKVVGLAEKGGGKSNILGQISDKDIDGQISTKSHRKVSSVAAVSDSKLLNGVTGQVSSQSLYNGTGKLSVSSLGDQLSLSGGEIPRSLIEKILAKHLDNFRYCYEKALLTDTSLRGNVMVKWTISTRGSVGGIKVIKSQIPNKKMQGCLSKEIAKIRFPKPKGGSVMISYPFKFSSTSI